jgi:hypothetical protein
MAKRCRVCGAWVASQADRMPFPEQLIQLYPFLGFLSDAAAEYDRASVRVKSGEMELTTAAEFAAWLDYEIRSAAGVTNGRSEDRPGSGMALLRAKDVLR